MQKRKRLIPMPYLASIWRALPTLLRDISLKVIKGTELKVLLVPFAKMTQKQVREGYLGYSPGTQQEVFRVVGFHNSYWMGRK